jgi:hypothetical protein
VEAEEQELGEQHEEEEEGKQEGKAAAESAVVKHSEHGQHCRCAVVLKKTPLEAVVELGIGAVASLTMNMGLGMRHSGGGSSRGGLEKCGKVKVFLKTQGLHSKLKVPPAFHGTLTSSDPDPYPPSPP